MSDFQTCSLGPSGLIRAPRVKQAYHEPDYMDRFDGDTLWFDAIEVAGGVVLICPRLTNLRAGMKRAIYKVDGQKVKPKLQSFYRHEMIWLPSDGPKREVLVQMGDHLFETAVSPNESAAFAGKNVLITLSKDNDLLWVEDYVRFHVHHQNVEAVIFTDNGSANYSTGDLEEAIRRGGAKTAKVLSAPIPYGPRGKKPFINTELYLQIMVMNTNRLRFLGQANGVLNADVDELVLSPGTTVFDLANQARLGFVRFRGAWRHLAPDWSGKPNHSGHIYETPGAKPCPTKWCINPRGPLKGLSWTPHSLERLPVDTFLVSDKAWFAHCSGITTGWKTKGRLSPPQGTVEDPALRHALADAGLG